MINFRFIRYYMGIILINFLSLAIVDELYENVALFSRERSLKDCRANIKIMSI